jgi:hypothetical protein
MPLMGERRKLDNNPWKQEITFEYLIIEDVFESTVRFCRLRFPQIRLSLAVGHVEVIC